MRILQLFYSIHTFALNYFWASDTGHIADIPFLLYSELVISYLIGPAFYFYFCLALGFKNNIRKTDLLHLVPLFLSLTGIILFRGEKPSLELKLVLVFLVFLILSSVILIFGIGSFTVFPTFYILFSFRYPEFSMRVSEDYLASAFKASE